MRPLGRNTRAQLMCGAICVSLMLSAVPVTASAQSIDFDIPPQSLSAALDTFAAQSRQAILVTPDMTQDKKSPGVVGTVEKDTALAQLLAGTGLTYRVSGKTFLIVQAGEGGSSPQRESAAGGGAEVDAVIVTAQKREENIQDVPIAISAFSQESLDQQKIEGGFDLLKAIPNVTFSKNNFTSYNFSIRGVGTKAISATTDPGVAVAFNSTSLIQNRLFEQEYFDVERVEVLRGPQGTLYGRNATSGVINVISAKPRLGEFAGWVKGEVGNYQSKRVSAMVNVPVIPDVLGVRFAGALTDRDGYDFNDITKNPVNGRSLWSGRLTVGFEPSERIHADLIWERFNEDDNRSRTGKQLCHRDNGPEFVGLAPVIDVPDDPLSSVLRPAMLSQGCKAGSLYDDAAFGTPNGLAIPFVFSLAALGNGPLAFFPIGRDPEGNNLGVIGLSDPYAGMVQSRNLRVISSYRDPIYRANADIIQLNLDVDVTDGLTLVSQTAYNKDTVYSFQDFNRFNTQPIFTDTSQLTFLNIFDQVMDYSELAPGGVFCDPQLGCTKSFAAFDVSTAEAEQFSQEIRLQSDLEGPVNFSAGANYTRFEALVDYIIMSNLLTAAAMTPVFAYPGEAGITYNATCISDKFFPGGTTGYVDIDAPGAICPYIDPNPVETMTGEGHNYFRSKNPYELESTAAFGELYWQATDVLKVTAGLRYTRDEKTFIPVPSQVLLAPGLGAGGTVNRGYPEKPPINQEWGEWTGRLGVDWKPRLAFTEETMLYAFYSRGYKGGGANPPSPGFATEDELVEQAEAAGLDPIFIGLFSNFFPVLQLTAVEYGPTFEPEFVDAFEVGAKNTLLGGAMTANFSAFFYDYKDYQVSQIRDRTAVNENFDATVWGLELETLFAPSRDLQVTFNLGYLDTAIADGEMSIDIMNRTQGDSDYTLVKPWLQLPSNCVAPTPVVEAHLLRHVGIPGDWFNICGGISGFIRLALGNSVIDPATGELYDPMALGDDGELLYPEINGGAGIKQELGGNELPNAPHWTASLGAQYGVDILEGWRATVRGDAYWQSQSWARVYNADPYDKLHGWYNVNLSLWLENEDGLKIEIYAKNLLDKTPITDAFLNSDDTALTTNVFVLDPRLVGLSIRKEF
jgi:iron complex outermembrane receptor protein